MAFTEQNRDELDDKGYTVVLGVLTEEECQNYIGQYRQWLATNFAEGEFPLSSDSLIQHYAIGHLEPSWRVRLKAHDVFAHIWGTNRLLSSIEPVAIGRPPEQGEEEFDGEDTGGCFHLDQPAQRWGLHAYQGAVYLETADEDDWTFEVMEKSHSFFHDFYYAHPEDMKRAFSRVDAKTRDEHLDWMKAKGCVQRRVTAPAGGMVVWDSRLILANARPKKGRRHPDRWRWVVFVCMAPFCWGTSTAFSLKRQAYVNRQMTTHWPYDEVRVLPTTLPSYAARELRPLKVLPRVARSKAAKRLAGALRYRPVTLDERDGDERLMGETPLFSEVLRDTYLQGGSSAWEGGCRRAIRMAGWTWVALLWLCWFWLLWASIT